MEIFKVFHMSLVTPGEGQELKLSKVAVSSSVVVASIYARMQVIGFTIVFKLKWHGGLIHISDSCFNSAMTITEVSRSNIECIIVSCIQIVGLFPTCTSSFSKHGGSAPSSLQNFGVSLMQNFGLSILMNEVAHFVSLQSTSSLDSLDVLIETNLVNLCEEFFLKYLPVPHVLYFLFLEVNLNRSSAPLDEPKPLVGLSSSSACGSGPWRPCRTISCCLRNSCCFWAPCTAKVSGQNNPTPCRCLSKHLQRQQHK